MGLDLSLAPADFDASIADEDEWEQLHKDYGHSRWHASYGGFHHFREQLGDYVGIELASMYGHGGKNEWANQDERAKTLQPLLDHSDCDGVLTYEECRTCLPTLIDFRDDLSPSDTWLQQSMDELITLFKECINLQGQVIFGMSNIPTEFKRIEGLWAWVSIDLEGEGVLAHEVVFDGSRVMMPLVGADEARMRSLEPLARDIVNDTGIATRLIQFSTRTEHETIEPPEGRKKRG